MNLPLINTPLQRGVAPGRARIKPFQRFGTLRFRGLVHERTSSKSTP